MYTFSQTKGVLCCYTYRRGLSQRCSFILLWAMREPRIAGRVTGTDSRAFFFIWINHYLFLNRPVRESAGYCTEKLIMNDFILNIDSFKKQMYDRQINGVYIHQSVNLVDKIYHYLKLDYLFDILLKEHFRFSNRSSFTDQSEKGKKSNIKNTFKMSPFISDEYDAVRYKEFETTRDTLIENSYKTCVSSWTYDIHHLSNSSELITEDFFMWKVYAGNGIGVRIETTIEDLINSFYKLPCDILVSKVSYKNEAPTYSVDEAIFTKPIYYEKEQELRLCALSPENEIFIKVDTTKLIHNILLSPFVSKECTRLLSKILESSFPMLKGKIMNSNILEYK